MQELITTILHYNIVQNNAANCRSQTNILIASSATTTNCKHHFHDWSTATSHSPLMPLVRVWNSRSLKVVYNCIVCHYGWSMIQPTDGWSLVIPYCLKTECTDMPSINECWLIDWSWNNAKNHCFQPFLKTFPTKPHSESALGLHMFTPVHCNTAARWFNEYSILYYHSISCSYWCSK